MSNAIEIRGVRKTFGPKVAVESLDLDVPEGSLYGFIGPNGAGKSTTIRMIMSIIFPDQGDLRVLGKASAVESKDRIGYLPEERGVYKKMKVGAFLNYMARLKGIDSATADKRVKEWLVRTGLQETYRKKCEELSKGMQQKVQFITSVIHEPDLLILDEVFTGLDPVNRRLMRELIQEQNDRGATIIFSTHAMREAEELCDNIFMIHKGEKVIDSSLEDVWRKYDPKTMVVEPMNASDIGRGWGGLPGVKEVVEIDGVLDLRLRDGADVAELMKQAAMLAPVRRLELKRASLEDIFIDIVGGSGGESAEKLRQTLQAGKGAATELEEVTRG
ncbi:MAG: ATP-binding cassette domain-containing protein [Phycisphaerales bacterium]|nr:ATP-binding cassette domain-containing protein [Phycisphaerales bacterium]